MLENSQNYQAQVTFEVWAFEKTCPKLQAKKRSRNEPKLTLKIGLENKVMPKRI